MRGTSIQDVSALISTTALYDNIGYADLSDFLLCLAERYAAKYPEHIWVDCYAEG